ncbi:MAG: HAMP domain-containing histidine kinase, partial [Holophagales bacterium]|nr:HAMP domain-containing histidine kinase [Holophagales bacterium]
ILIGLVIIYRVLRQEVVQQRQFKDFFAAFSHELKTPIAAMKLQTETILSLDLPKEKRDKLLANMLEDLERLELTIENILDVFRIEAGRLRIDARPVELDPWLKENLETHARAFAEHRLNIDFDLRSAANVALDERYFQTVLANIIQNCVRYANGDPTLSVRSELRDGEAELSFRDSGVGFRPEDCERIFEKYYRIDGENGQKHKGAGLGLFLSRQIVVAHGGSISAASDGEGTGAEFVITLPIAKSDEPGKNTDR